jgi:hypothetical protein
MNARIALMIGGVALNGMLLASCGRDNHSASMPTPTPQPMTMELDTSAVLAIVQTKTTDTTEPFDVDNGAVAVTPVGDETSAPMSVDAT